MHIRELRISRKIIQAFYEGIKHKPETTFGNVKPDVLADKDPHFTRGNFCSVIRDQLGLGKPLPVQSKIKALRLPSAEQAGSMSAHAT